MIDLQEREISSTKLLGGRPCLDFVNTMGGRRERKGIESYVIRAERLKDYADLLAWGIRTGLLSANEAQRLLRESLRNPSVANAVWKRAISLRETIYRIVLSAVQNKQPKQSDMEVFNRELSIAHSQLVLVSGKKGFHWHWNEENALDRILWVVSDSAAEMLTTADLTRLRQCPGEDCGWLFDDTTRNRSRQWCDMKDCGNIAKVRRFRSRVQ